MRNLALWKTTNFSLVEAEFSSSTGATAAASATGSEGSSTVITAVALDLDQDVLYLTTESKTRPDDSEVAVAVWRLSNDDQDVPPTQVATFNTPTLSATNPWTSGGAAKLPPKDAWRDPEVLSLHVVPDEHTLVAVTRAGDIVTISLDEEPLSAEVVGSVDGGVMGVAWSPDDTILVLVTGEDKLILMTTTFDVLSEGPLHPTEFGEDAPINVGWGAKHTQFHGSAGKAAAQTSVPLTAVGASPDDDGHARVSWRGDAAFFAVSVLEGANETETRPHRRLRVYSREGALQSTAEPVPGLEHGCAWRPSGGLIASTQRFGRVPGSADADGGLGQGRDDRHDVVFFERNGLRHGEFALREKVDGPGSGSRRWGYRAREVGWSTDSNVLSVWLERDDGDVVQLWTTGNYHWYLKQEIVAPSRVGSPGRFTNVQWHPENPLRIMLTTETNIIQHTYTWDTLSSPAAPPVDSGSVAVIDGVTTLLTPFRSQNVPPPMAAYTLQLTASPSPLKRAMTPSYVAFSATRDLLAVLWEAGYLEIYDLRTRLGPGRGKIMDHELYWSGFVGAGGVRQVVFEHDLTTKEIVRLAVLGTDAAPDSVDIVYIMDISGADSKNAVTNQVALPSRNGRFVPGPAPGIVWQARDGTIYTVNWETNSAQETAKLPEFCFWTAHATLPTLQDISTSEPAGLYIGSSGTKLYATNGQATLTLASNANSFTLTPDFLIYTTTAHVAHFAPLPALPLALSTNSIPDFETRRVERGSRIVCAVPSAMSLVLQMPRGNLETVHPRPLVLAVVRQDIARGEYGKAFSACRRHRIDLNVFVEHNPEAFMRGVPAFVDQVEDVDYINLFVTNISQGSLIDSVVTQICDAVREELEKKDLKKYVNSILTAHVMKRPPDHEAGLALLLRLKESEPDLVEDAVKYIIFLVDADRLFDTALGMYDFSLVLMVAQHAQKDPREYLPFLRELRSLDQHYQRFRIDDHLKRYQKALSSLYEAGLDRFDEAMAYVEKHRLYEHALALWQGSDNYDSVLSIYGEWLYDRREFREAAFVFRQANKPEKAMVSHEMASDWRELFEIAVQHGTKEEDLQSMAHRVSEDLVSKNRTSEAAQVLLDYAQDARQAVIVLVEGSHLSEARRIIALHRRQELMEEIVHPGALECRARIAEEIGEMREQLRKQLIRVRELRVRKVEEPDAFYGVEDTDLHNVDVMTDVSMAPTAFTRYTVAPSAVSKTSSKRSSRSKRKLERKVGSGRKGTVDEEEYLLKSVGKLVVRFNTTQVDSASLLPHLLQFTEEHREEAASLRADLIIFSEELAIAVEEIWTKPSEPEENVEQSGQPHADSWAARMEAHEKRKHANPVDTVPRPELAKSEWKLQLPDGRAQGVQPF